MATYVAPLAVQAFLQQGNKLISCSKDSHIRVWDLDTQHCSQTLVGYRGEVWALALNPSQTRLVTGSADVDLEVYEVMSTEANAAEADVSGQHDTLRAVGNASFAALKTNSCVLLGLLLSQLTSGCFCPRSSRHDAYRRKLFFSFLRLNV